MSVNLQVRLAKAAIAALVAFIIFLIFQINLEDSFLFSLYVAVFVFFLVNNKYESLKDFLSIQIKRALLLKRFIKGSIFRKTALLFSFLWMIYGAYIYFNLINYGLIYNDFFYFEKLNFINFLFKVGVPVYYTGFLADRIFSFPGFFAFILAPVVLMYFISFVVEWIFGDDKIAT